MSELMNSFITDKSASFDFPDANKIEANGLSFEFIVTKATPCSEVNLVFM